MIAMNEEANLPRTLESVRWADEIILVDSGSKDRTLEIARNFGVRVFQEPWKGFAEGNRFLVSDELAASARISNANTVLASSWRHRGV